ncbi:MAG: MaoC/PaaZ C-terminal domain-containing protein [Phreatobacter sp.]|uniref:MaoC family dehydratase n=1 Tax=Phreatobacter sp. TaxID=1966341 RepID=UPI0027345874|nr:MaoC/PaaZ C-terminal domain-containing protein [Phreatobacter sp.]MDP2801976.1 MaoC/PaaZ C-terminal domain-containing protein [Phreatobacter sp.]
MTSPDHPLPLGTVLPDRHFASVDMAMVRRYAAASGDDNPIHVDAAAARSIGLADPIVQGMLLMGLADTALGGWLPEGTCAKLSTRFALPVPVGAAVTVSGRVVRADQAEGRARATLRIFIRDEAGKAVALAEAIVLL